jgi:hypothetical protein
MVTAFFQPWIFAIIHLFPQNTTLTAAYFHEHIAQPSTSPLWSSRESPSEHCAGILTIRDVIRHRLSIKKWSICDPSGSPISSIHPIRQSAPFTCSVDSRSDWPDRLLGPAKLMEEVAMKKGTPSTIGLNGVSASKSLISSNTPW